MDIPDYILDEIDKYREEKKNNKQRFTTYENIIAYISMAKMTKRITEEDAEEIKELVRKI